MSEASLESPETTPFDTVEDAIDAISSGEVVIVTDDEDRENEGDLIMAASKATPESVNLMIRFGSGVICVPTVEPILKRLGINPMVANNRESHRTDFTVSVDAASNITTGISASDRCATIRLLADPQTRADQLVQPGHIFPLRARPGGVLERSGHTEAAVDLSVLAGLEPCGVICEIMNEDGTMARVPELTQFKRRFNLKMISIKQLIEYRLRRDTLVERVAQHPIQNQYGAWSLHIFRSIVDQRMHYALVKGELSEDPVLVRVQSENILVDVFGDSTSEASTPDGLDRSMKAIAEAGRGALVYLTRPCEGLDFPGLTTSTSCRLEPRKVDFRGYGIGAQVLAALKLKKIRLLAHQKRRHIGLEAYGLEIVEQIPV